MKVNCISHNDMNKPAFGAGVKYVKAVEQIRREFGAGAIPETFEKMGDFIVKPDPRLRSLITNSSFFAKTRKSADMFISEFNEQTKNGIMNTFYVFFKKGKNTEQIYTIKFPLETKNADEWYNELGVFIKDLDKHHEAVFSSKPVASEIEEAERNAIFMVKVLEILPQNIVNKIWYQKPLTQKEQVTVSEAIEKISKTYSEEEFAKITIVETHK